MIQLCVCIYLLNIKINDLLQDLSIPFVYLLYLCCTLFKFLS